MNARQTPVTDYPDMPAHAWRILGAASDHADHPMRWHSVATVGPEGTPNVRTLVIRGAARDPGAVWYHTDVRTPKIEQLRAHPAICSVCYDAQLGLQLRLDGAATIHHGDREARHHWGQYGAAVRYAYGISHRPGERLAQTDPRTHAARERRLAGHEDDGFEHFAVIEVRVDSIDWFQSTALMQRRAVLERSSDWQPVALMP